MRRVSSPAATFDPSLSQVQDLVALGSGVALVALGARQRSWRGLWLALAATPFFYRGAVGRWPERLAPPRRRDESRVALAGPRGIHVRESVRLERPVADVYAFWRDLSNLPRFMTHLESVTEESSARSHWVARGPAGVKVSWDAEILNEIEGRVIGWRSLPGSEVVTAGSVNFETVREGRSTQLTVHLQYEPPAGRAGAWVATLFGRAPAQTIREDLRRFKQLLETGEFAQAGEAIPAGPRR